MSIDTVNLNANPAFFRDNENGALPIEYDGLTVLLRAAANNLVVGSDYTLTFDIRDQGDAVYDSAVFIQDGSVAGGDPPPPGAVPEPASWLTMILGLGVAGAALRGRRRGTGVVAA